MTTKDYQTKSPLKVFMFYLKKHKGLFILDMACAFLVAVIDLIYPFVSRIAMYTWLPNQAYKAFFSVMGIIALSYVLRSLLYYVVMFWGHRFGVLVEADIRLDLFEHIQSLEFSFFDNTRIGQLMSRITSDLFEVVELAHHGPEDVLISLVTIIGSLILVATIDWRLAIILAVVLPLFLVILVKMRDWRRRVSADVKVNQGYINNQIESTVSGMRTGKAFANERLEYKKFLGTVDAYKESKRDFYKCLAVFNSSMEFFCCIISVIVMAFGGWMIMRGELNYVDLITFCLYINTFITPIRKLVNFTETYASGSAGFNRFLEIMRMEPKIRDAKDAKKLEVFGGSIELKDVSFQYKENKEVLKNVNLKLEAGETLAVVGASGGGKTTMCQLIPRFYDVDEGSILIDGQDIRAVTQESLHQNIGIVQQDVFLFADTILENIRYGNPLASDAQVIEAAKRAEIYDDIMAMPDKFETYVGERGTLLSGGQKQRVAIARIFLKNPPILILDEATSALDSITESRIQNAFDELSKGRTCMIIAHRLSTIKKANRIVVVDSGEIKEEGSHEELMAQNGIYTNLYNTQMSFR